MTDLLQIALGSVVRSSERNLQLRSPLLSFVLGKLTLTSFELEQFLLRRLKKAVARCYYQLRVSRHLRDPIDCPPSPYYPSTGPPERFGSEILRNDEIRPVLISKPAAWDRNSPVPGIES
jgi:hypothetical protein